jgi:transcription termination/antitermination protein NusG
VTEESNKPTDEPTLPKEDESVQGDATEVLEGPSSDTPPEEASSEPEASLGEPAEEAPATDTPDEPDEVVESAEQPSPDAAEEPPREASSDDDSEAVEEPVEPASEEASPIEDEEDAEERNMDWYILKVQSNREDSIRDGMIRRVKIAGLEDYFGEVIVPTEKVTEFKGGKKRVTKRKLYPGYIVVNMEINDDTWFLVRETPGIGDFTGAAGTPTPMLPHEVQRILAKKEEKQDEVPKLKIGFSVGDRVKINEGTFENFEGEVHTIDETSGRVTVMINIFGRSTPVELEYWQIESV